MAHGLGAAIFSIYGPAFRSESAVAAATGSLVILVVQGTVFFPLPGTVLTIATFTPLHGYLSPARRAPTAGYILNGTSSASMLDEPPWQPVTNMTAWALIVGALAIGAARVGRRRQ